MIVNHNDFHFFWSGPFSQWHPSNFTIENVQFNCAEQFMMYQKALLFNDFDSAEKIMEAKSPVQQKALGKLVKNFDLNLWQQNCKLIVYRGNLTKFCQNPALYIDLMKTGNKTLVEASPYDSIWGIGLLETDPRALNRSEWKGTNWLGEILTKLKCDIIK